MRRPPWPKIVFVRPEEGNGNGNGSIDVGATPSTPNFPLPSPLLPGLSFSLPYLSLLVVLLWSSLGSVGVSVSVSYSINQSAPSIFICQLWIASVTSSHSGIAASNSRSHSLSSSCSNRFSSLLLPPLWEPSPIPVGFIYADSLLMSGAALATCNSRCCCPIPAPLTFPTSPLW